MSDDDRRRVLARRLYWFFWSAMLLCTGTGFTWTIADGWGLYPFLWYLGAILALGVALVADRCAKRR